MNQPAPGTYTKKDRRAIKGNLKVSLGPYAMRYEAENPFEIQCFSLYVSSFQRVAQSMAIVPMTAATYPSTTSATGTTHEKCHVNHKLAQQLLCP